MLAENAEHDDMEEKKKKIILQSDTIISLPQEDQWYNVNMPNSPRSVQLRKMAKKKSSYIAKVRYNATKDSLMRKKMPFASSIKAKSLHQKYKSCYPVNAISWFTPDQSRTMIQSLKKSTNEENFSMVTINDRFSPQQSILRKIRQSKSISRPSRKTRIYNFRINHPCHWFLVHCASEAQSYNLASLKNALKKLYITAFYLDETRQILQFNASCLIPQFDLGCLDQPLLQNQYSTHESNPDHMTCHVFAYGTWVLWGIPLRNYGNSATISFVEFLSLFLAQFSEGVTPDTPYGRLQLEYCLPPLEIENSKLIPPGRVLHDHIFLRDGSNDELIAISIALCQSCRLTIYEEAVDEYIQKFDDLPLFIQKKKYTDKRIYLQIRQLVSDIYSLILNINAYEDFSVVPNYFWHNPDYELVFNCLHTYLEIDERVQILNVRVGYFKEILSVISWDRVDAQGSRLTWFIIVLLLINVLAKIYEAFLGE